MKIYLASDTGAADGVVTFVHFLPLDPQDGLGKTEEELNQIGKVIEVSEESVRRETFLSEYFGVPMRVDSTQLTACIDSETKVLTYKYMTIPTPPKTEKELLAEQQSQLLIMQDTINTLLGL